ncbi:MAG: hypothetical protein D6797_04570, partial [Bdellovibrio sp.]
MSKAKSGTVEERLSALDELAKYPYEEVDLFLTNQLIREINRITHKDDLDLHLLYKFLIPLIRWNSSSFKKSINRIITQLAKKERLFSQQIDDKKLSYASLIMELKTAQEINKQPVQLPSIFSLPDAPNNSQEIEEISLEGIEGKITKNPDPHSSFHKWRKLDLSEVQPQIKKALKERVISQKEAIESLTHVLVEDVIFGHREHPIIKFFMGLPGTGKDTLAKAFVDALHGYDGAWKRHMKIISPLKSPKELWSLLGSGTGYVGSDKLSDLIHFIVDHSGGRYYIEESVSVSGNVTEKVLENPNWENSRNSNEFFPSESAVLFVNEVHNWDKEALDAFFKMFIENGLVKINSPNGGLAELYTNINIIFASNHGINLITPLRQNGERVDPNPSYPSMINNWKRNHTRYKLIKKELSKQMSIEMVNRFEDEDLILLAPFSSKEIQQIVEQKLQQLKQRFLKSKTSFKNINLSWSPQLVQFIQEYNYFPSENARAVNDNVKVLVKRVLLDAFASGKIPEPKSMTNLYLDIQQNDNGTSSLLVSISPASDQLKEPKTIPLLIPSTLKNRPPKPLTDKELDHLFSLEASLKKHLFGLDSIIERLSQRILVAEEAQHDITKPQLMTEPAISFAFFGLSSTGKTYLMEKMAEEICDDPKAFYSITLNATTSIPELERMLFGYHKTDGTFVPSDFLLLHDAFGGRIILGIDEASNAPKETSTALYDLLRKPVIQIPGREEPIVMSKTIIVLSGNVGEEIYQNIPKNLPDSMRRSAMYEAYLKFIKNKALKRALLETKFTEAMINRIGEPNIFFFPPLNYKSSIELMQSKVLKVIEDLKPKDHRRGWFIGFQNQEEFLEIINEFEKAAFIVSEQGASIDRFARNEFGDQLRYLLLKNKIPTKKKIILRLPQTEEEKSLFKNLNKSRHQVPLLVFIEEQETPIPFLITGKEKYKFLPQLKEQFILTAYHEAGHAVAKQTFFHDTEKPHLISLKPGVEIIDGQTVVFSGIASSEEKVRPIETRSSLLRDIAVLLSGYMAESLVTKGQRHTIGKSNDIERATLYAYKGVLKFGLSQDWGEVTLPPDADLMQFVASFSEEKKKKLEKEVSKILNSARQLSRTSLAVNFSLLTKLAVNLAEKAELKKEDLEKLYGESVLYDEYSKEFSWVRKFDEMLVKLTSIAEPLSLDTEDILDLLKEVQLIFKDEKDLSQFTKKNKVVRLLLKQIQDQTELSSRATRFIEIFNELYQRRVELQN